MISYLSGLPVWIVLLLCTALLLTIMFGARALVNRYTSGDHQAEVIDLAKSMNGPTGAALAFLVGFAVSISWGATSAAQTAVEKVASQAQQIALVVGSLQDQAAAQTLTDDINKYLLAISDQDRSHLAAQELGELPSFASLVKLQQDLTDLKNSSGPDAAVARALQSPVESLASAQADLNAVARRHLPPAVLQMLTFMACLSAATVGILAVKTKRPYLIVGWAIASAMGLTVVIALNNPFVGDVSVSFDALHDAAERIHLTPPGS